MSKKIITNIFNYARQEGAHSLVVSNQENHIALDCCFPNGSHHSLILPKKLEQDFFSNLQQILAIAPGELLTKKYHKIRENGCELNVSLTVLPDGQGEKIIINIGQTAKKIWRLNQLGLKSSDLKILRETLQRQSGLIIFSSPAAGGKSSTLRACLNELDNSSLNIYAFENSQENKIEGINWLLPNTANWEKVMRHDSDVIAIEDLDTADNLKKAFLAAVSGRLVLGTMTADSLDEVFKKIKKIELPLKLKLDSLKLITGQRLTALKRPFIKSHPESRQTIGRFQVFKLTPDNRKKLEKFL